MIATAVIFDSTVDQSFAYDGANRMTTAAGLYRVRSYHYDRIGNRERLTVDTPAVPCNSPLVAPAPRALIYNDAGRIESITVSGVLAGTYLYNAF